MKRVILVVTLVLMLMGGASVPLAHAQAVPQFTTLTPVPDTTINAGLTRISARISSDTPITSTTLTLDGVRLTPAVTGGGSGNSLIVTIDWPVGSGSHSVSLSASNTAGQTGTASWSFTASDTGEPRFSNLTPAPGSSVPAGIIRVAISVIANNNIGPVVVAVDGTTIDTEGGGPTATQVTNFAEVTLAPGTHTIFVAASTSTGQSNGIQWTFTAVQTAPAFSNLTPAQQSGVPPGTVVVSALVTSNSPITAASISVDGLPRTTSIAGVGATTATISTSVSLITAVHEVTATATNASGATGSIRWAFVVTGSTSQITCFAETGHCLAFGFRDFWNANGGLSIFGFPITEEFQEQNQPPPFGDGLVHTVQYFERQRFEFHPENPPQFQVLGGLLGVQVAQLEGILNSPPFQPAARLNNPSCAFFSETQHNLCFGFRTFWNTRGLAIFGFPISEEFVEQNPPPPFGDGKVHTVQYFERARFEFHPENQDPYRVLLGLLGRVVLPPGR